jgi:hypothetical protein
MLTMNIFNSLHTLLAEATPHDRDLAVWAKTEYKSDAEYAYFHMKRYGAAPKLGVKA